KHRHLVKMFFKNARTMLSRTGEIHVSHKVKDPYNKWKVLQEAKDCGLVLKEFVEFIQDDYPGYTNRRGAGPMIGETFFLGECRTYMFIQRESITASIMLPKISSKDIWEIAPDGKNRGAAEIAKANMESSLNHLKTLADKTIKERDEFERQRNEAVHQRDLAVHQRDEAIHQSGKAWRENENITKQLDEALRLKEEVMKDRERIRKERNDLAKQRDEVSRENEKIAKR
ncbi:hypothetical protein KI387_017936, partial [Taxus chinensis]